MGIKNAEFHADFEAVEKVVKNAQKRDGNKHFFHFYSCSSNLFCL